MRPGNKTINSNSVMIIATLKSNIRFAENPFDGTGYPFKQAVKELKKEGVSIIYNKTKCHYYNAKTVHPKWGY